MPKEMKTLTIGGITYEIVDAKARENNSGSGALTEGVSPTVTVSKSDKVLTITITDVNGTKTATVNDGADGKTPVKGADYWTEEDKTEIRDEDIAFLSQELAKRQQLTPEYANDISGCTDTSKLYVLPDGYIYAYILGEGTGTKTETVTPVWQLGVKLDKSTGAEGSGENYTACEPIYIGDGETYVFSVANNYYLSGVANCRGGLFPAADVPHLECIQ